MKIPKPTGLSQSLQVFGAPEEARGQRQPAFRRALACRQPTMKSVMIYADSGGDDHLVLVRFTQVSLQNRHQLIWTRRFGCC